MQLTLQRLVARARRAASSCMQLCSLLLPLAEQRLRVVLAGALLLDGSLCAVSAAVRGRGGQPAAS